MNNNSLGRFSGSVVGLDPAAINKLNRKLIRRRAFREAVSGYLFIAPATLLLILFFFLPTLYAFVVSFFRWDFMDPVKTYVGFGNYVKLITSAEFWYIMWTTVYYMLGAIPIAMFFAPILALCINERPANTFVAGFIGNPPMNLIACRIDKQGRLLSPQE